MKPRKKFTLTIWVRPSYCDTDPAGPGGDGGTYEFKSFITTTDEDDTPPDAGDPTPRIYDVATCRDESTIEVRLLAWAREWCMVDEREALVCFD